MRIEFSLKELVKLAETKALIDSDGHFTVFKFTTNWKVSPGTPNLDIGKERENVRKLEAFPTLEEALKDYIIGGHQ